MIWFGLETQWCFSVTFHGVWGGKGKREGERGSASVRGQSIDAAKI